MSPILLQILQLPPLVLIRAVILSGCAGTCQLNGTLI